MNDVKTELWVPTLISVIGDETYELLSNLASPRKPAALKYDEIINVIRSHLQPKPSVMAERYRFRQRRQLTEETVLQYITELKKLSKHCEFGDSLEDNLRDQPVCGIKSDIIRQRLFAEDSLSYAKAVKLSCALEAAERDAAVVEPGAGGGLAGSGTAAAHALHAHAVAQGGARGGRRPRDRATAPPQRRRDAATGCGYTQGHEWNVLYRVWFARSQQ